jgi:hypothetical protein
MRRYLAMTLIPMAACASAQTPATAQVTAAPSAPAQPTAVQPATAMPAASPAAAQSAAGAANSGYGSGRRHGGYNRPNPVLVIDADAIIAAQQAADRAENAAPPPAPGKSAKSKRGLHLSTSQPLSTSTGNP